MKSIKQSIYQYMVLFERNERGGYTVTAPALPGLVTEGKNLENARLMAQDAIRCYIEGLRKLKEKIPEEKEIVQARLTISV
ncbi:type II toxin-antitoxin system HicB family antitoxin [Candidatus Wolfebacteria bacterium]|nr:type II toxin-antitoxin system HicB family antitoxin [Candidatus Wolfebacteria bacterium]